VFGAWAGIATVIAACLYREWKGEFWAKGHESARANASEALLKNKKRDLADCQAVNATLKDVNAGLRAELEEAKSAALKSTLEAGQQRGTVQRLERQLAEHREQLHDVRNQLQTALFKNTELTEQLQRVHEASRLAVSIADEKLGERPGEGWGE
jgi:hypothetical protein